MTKRNYENDIDYKGFNIIIWNDNGKRVFAIGNKDFPNIVIVKEWVDNIRKQEDAYKDDDGVWRWVSNDQVPFKEMLECWGLDDDTMQKCVDARDKDTSEFLVDYKERMKDYVPSDEERFEMRAAFGKETVVNVITGKIQ